MPGMEAVYDRVGKMENATKVAILLATLAAVGLGYCVGFYRGVKDKRDRLQGTLAVEKKKLADATKTYKAYLKVKRQTARLRVTSLRLIKSLPESGEIPLGSIHKMADAAGIVVTSVEREDEDEHTGYARIPIKMTIRGQYHRVMEFFWKLGKMDRIVKVSNVKMENPRLQDGQILLTVTCEAATYRYLAHRSRKSKGGR
ncbi:MAG: type 4a pilus biogenesis protein PilO [Deltaproteobacteria bacterium]|nr:type 4a pilus biogenesis protein PilO [Deltaproteobacteria bacterium]